MSNPYSITFGVKPNNYIDRGSLSNSLLKAFDDETSSNRVCLITGVRGSGKTTELSYLSSFYKKNDEWVVVQLAPERDMIHHLAAELSNANGLSSLFKDAQINLSLLGFGISIDGVPPITDEVVAIKKMLGALKKHNKKVVIIVDEVTPSQNMIVFSSVFQMLLRDEIDNIYLIMAGLYDNIRLLQDQKTLTFLYRAPKIELKPLKTRDIMYNYKGNFNLTDEEALSMAKETLGYPFAFQILGYLKWDRSGEPYEDIIHEYDRQMEEYVYEKLWYELSNNDKNILIIMALYDLCKIEEIRNKLNISSNLFNVYRKRLINKGILVSKSFGYLDFILPRFNHFIIENGFEVE